MGWAARVRKLRLRFIEEGGLAKLDPVEATARQLLDDPATLKFPGKLSIDESSVKTLFGEIKDVSQS